MVAPNFTSPNSFNLNENQTVVGNVVAADPDAAGALTYAITGGADSARFSIDTNTGALSFVSAPNFEAPGDVGTNNIYDVEVTATDVANETAVQQIAVTVANVDEAPSTPIDSNVAANTVAENAIVGTAVGVTAQATDPEGAAVTYTLTNNAGGAFQIDATTGVVTVADPTQLNFEAATSKTITVQATDATTNTSTTTDFTIGVTDVNEAPVITSNGGGANATISVAENQTAVTTVAATDVDASDTLSYSVSGTDAGFFTIDPTTGVLTFTNAPNFEAPADAGANNVYDVVVTATDAGGLTDTQALAITVTDANEAPTAPTDSNVAANTVAENAVVGTAVGVTALATDPDSGAILTYTLTNNAGGAFQIDATTGVVTVADPTQLNFEAATSKTITVQASDGTNATTANFTIAVTDVNEAPVITSNGGGANATISVAENQVAVTTVIATDVDASDTQTYSLSGADAGLFTIDATTGVLTFTNAPNFEAPADVGSDNVYNITVTATDAGGQADSQALAITVTDANEAPTAPTDGNVAANTVAENAAAGTAVGVTALATDPDFGTILTYTLTNNAGGAFQIDSTTGVVTVADPAQLNFEAATSKTITVQASDGTNATTSNFTIAVTNVNEAPVITSNGGGANATISVAENQTAVTTVTATDVDAGDTRTFTLSGTDAAFFTLNAATGVLTFTNAPNFEAPADAGANNVYDVVVTATDAGGLTDTQALAITVTDVNEPVAPQPPAPTPQPPVTDGTSGNDTISAGTSTTPVFGGAGSDQITATPAAGTTAQLFGGSSITDPNDAGDTISVSGGGSAVVYGNGGDDQIVVTSTGAASVYGGVGNDQVTITNDAANQVTAGPGADVIQITGNGNNQVLGGSSITDPNDGADRITISGNGNNLVYANGGDDVIVFTGTGNNTVFGGVGNDTITGGSGADRIVAGPGSNVLTGGAGADRFVHTAGGQDIITDFNFAAGDRIELGGQPYAFTQTSDGNAAILIGQSGVIVLQGVAPGSLTADYLA